MKYRPEIDGLRALAVLAVVLFHVAPMSLPGGYVGVDVFFVISGFLITRIIVDQLEEGRFSLAEFYLRRVRRIFPAFVVVTVAVAAAGYATFLPADFRNLGKHVVGATLSISNIVSMTEFDYFAPASHLKPLLHAWSLGVEEQFYLLFPLLLLFLARGSPRKRIRVGLVVVCAASFIANLLFVRSHPTLTFFLTFTRMWELMIGSLLALLPPAGAEGAGRRRALEAVGLTLLLAPMVAFSDRTTFPGVAALAPCLGSALLIRYSHADASLVRRALSSPPMRLIGKMSYSIYLWHWPLLVFAQYLLIRRLEWSDRAVILALTFIASFLSWRFVETPFRHPKGQRRTVFAVAFLVAGGLSAFGLLVFARDGLPGRLPEAVLRLDEASRYRPEIEPGPLASGDPPQVFVWGDSHVSSLYPMLRDGLQEKGREGAYYWGGGWLPLTGIDRPGLTGFMDTNQEVLASIQASSTIDTVILIARWVLYTEGYAGNIGPAEPYPAGPRFTDDQGRRPRTPEETYALFTDAVRTTVGSLLDSGKTVVLVYPIPEAGYNVPTALAKTLVRKPDFDVDTWITPRDGFLMRNARVLSALDALESHERLVRIRPAEALATGQGFRVTLEGAPLYFDSNHLNPAGAALLKPLFIEHL